MKEIIFYNLDEIVVDKSLLSDSSAPDKWQVIPYETKDYKGKLVGCGEIAKPKAVTFDVGLKGWYKIYFGIIPITWKLINVINIKGYGKRSFENFWPDWDPNEWIDEVYYSPVNLQDGLISLEKSYDGDYVSCGLAFIKLIEMSQEEIDEQLSHKGGVLSVHSDEDDTGILSFDKNEEYLGLINPYEGLGGTTIYYESCLSGKVFKQGEKRYPYLRYVESKNEIEQRYLLNHIEIRNMFAKRAHELGFKFYSANRIQMGDFHCPTFSQFNNAHAFEMHPECAIYTRDKRKVETLSFAYSEVREMAIESILTSLHGVSYDGVQLLFHRGIFFGFEEPICEYVFEHYNIDARRLPLKDSRLNEAYIFFMSKFLQDLHNRLDDSYGKNKMKISIVSFYDIESSKMVGLDIEYLAKKHLIDEVCQGLMTWDEDLDGIIDDDGLINMEKFICKNGTKPVLLRHYDGDNVEKIVHSSIEFQKLLDPYNVVYKATLGWHCADLNYTHNLACKLHDAGIRLLYSWNGDAKLRNINLYHTEEYISKHYNDLKERTDYSHRKRVLKFGDKDISSFNANWNG